MDLVARLWAEADRQQNIKLSAGVAQASIMREAADEIERLRKAATRAAEIIDVNLHHQREKVTDAAAILRAALNPI
jgi:hypothetical protein